MSEQAIRILSYEFNNIEELQRQLGRSLPDGIRDVPGKGTIRVITLPERFTSMLGAMARWANETAHEQDIGGVGDSVERDPDYGKASPDPPKFGGA